MDINELWNEMEKRDGETFYTVTGLPFVIEQRTSNYFDVYRNDKKARLISKDNMEFILNNPNEQRSVYMNEMTCSSYALSVYYTIIEELKYGND